MRKKAQWYLVAAVVVIVLGAALVLSRHSNSSTSSSASSSLLSSAVSTNQVTISGYMFMPETIKVKVGTKVTWTNQDPVHHSITADVASINAPNSPLIGKGQTYTFTFNKTGTYTFHCMPHPYMHGTVIVTN